MAKREADPFLATRTELLCTRQPTYIKVHLSGRTMRVCRDFETVCPLAHSLLQARSRCAHVSILTHIKVHLHYGCTEISFRTVGPPATPTAEASLIAICVPP